MTEERDVVVVGGGLAGLVCANLLQKAGRSCRLLEANEYVGGRVHTEEMAGFRLDRGFQVFLTAYPEAKSLLDYEALNLCRFEPGALVRYEGKFHRLADPWRRPQHLLSTTFSQAASFADKLRIIAFRKRTTQASLESIYTRRELPTIELLRNQGFSDVIIERFLRPFLGGVFLDQQLETSSRLCEFVFRMFSLGDAALPATGMAEIPRQLACQLAPGVIATESPVEAIQGQDVVLASGQRVRGKAIVIATEAPSARKLLGDPYPADGRSVVCHYFAADRPPLSEPILVLNGEGSGPINNLCVPSQVSSRYAPAGKSLVSVTTLPPHGDHADAESDDVRAQLKSWFGETVDSWQHLKAYSIDYALPVQTPPALQPVAKQVFIRDGLFVCGDHCDTASINGAMASGRRAAEAIIAGHS